MRDITEIRAEIDQIDTELTKLFERRMTVSEEVAAYKKANGLPTLNAQREKEVIAKACARLENKDFAPYTEKLYTCLMDLSKDYQKSMNQGTVTIGFQGIKGSFSHEACLWYMENSGDEVNYDVKSYETFDKLCLGLLNDEITQAVIPFENSSTGAVTDVYDLLLSYDYRIVGEICVKVNQNLMAKPGVKIEDIKEVYSHPQAFMQSKAFLDMYSFKQIPYKNTAISAEFVSSSDRGDIACIASEKAAELYGLKILEHNINYNVNNYTKFVVLSKKDTKSECNNKISIITKLDNTPGQLFNLTKLFKDHNINMVKIESRPDINNPFEYVFFIDIIGNIEDANVQAVIEEIKSANKYFKYMGNYKKFEF